MATKKYPPIYTCNTAVKSSQRTTGIITKTLLREAKQYMCDKSGYIIRVGSKGNRVVAKFGGFVPSAQEENSIRATCSNFDSIF